jgi:N-acetylneuraminic acid mutarotase
LLNISTLGSAVVEPSKLHSQKSDSDREICITCDLSLKNFHFFPNFAPEILEKDGVRKKTMKTITKFIYASVGLLLCATQMQADLCTPDTWQTKAVMPQSASEACAAVVGGKLYIFDGPTQVYDPAADSWSLKTPDPVYRGLGAAGTINGKIYVAEGWQNHDSNSATQALNIYDPATDSWTAGASSLVARGNSVK